jgi:hypothetical protein
MQSSLLWEPQSDTFFTFLQGLKTCGTELVRMTIYGGTDLTDITVLWTHRTISLTQFTCFLGLNKMTTNIQCSNEVMVLFLTYNTSKLLLYKAQHFVPYSASVYIVCETNAELCN